MDTANQASVPADSLVSCKYALGALHAPLSSGFLATSVLYRLSNVVKYLGKSP